MGRSFLDDYEPVEARLERFWAEHPSGRIATELHAHDAERVVFVATVWTDRSEAEPAATGWAHEERTDRGVNSTSHVENCETSAIGRALANLGYAPKGKRPSREEMSKAKPAGQNAGSPPPKAGGAPNCVVCHEPLSGKAVKVGSGRAHEKCAEEPF